MFGSGYLELVEGSGSPDNGSNRSSNDSEACYSLETAPSWALYYHATVLTAILLVSILGNALVLVLFARFKKLRTRSVVVSMSMVVADLLFTLTYTLQVIITTVNARWVFGDHGCTSFGFLASNLLITRWLIVSLLCLDRFLYVRFPFSYERRGKCVLVTFTTLAWVLPLVVSTIPPVGGFVMFELRENQPACLPNCIGALPVCRAYYFLIFTIIFVLGSILPIVLYSWLYCKARKLRKSVNHMLGHLTIQIAGGVVVSQPVGEHNNLVKREKRATITFVFIIASVVITGTPGYILQIFRSLFFDLQCQTPIYVHFIVIEFFLCAPMLTPLVIMRDRDFRRCLVKFLCCRRKTADVQADTAVRSPTDNKAFVLSRRSSLANNNSTPQSSQENGGSSHGNNMSCNRTRSNSISSKPAVYTISESSESLPAAPFPT